MENKKTLENIAELDLLKTGDVIETEAFGNIVYFTNADGKMIFVRKDKPDTLIKLRIPKEKMRIGDDGKIYFSGSSYSYIHDSQIEKKEYEKLNGVLAN